MLSGDDGLAASDSGSDRLAQDPSEEEPGVSGRDGRDGDGNKAASFARAFAKVKHRCFPILQASLAAWSQLRTVCWENRNII